jgi:hypothetical protein
MSACLNNRRILNSLCQCVFTLISEELSPQLHCCDSLKLRNMLQHKHNFTRCTDRLTVILSCILTTFCELCSLDFCFLSSFFLALMEFVSVYDFFLPLIQTYRHRAEATFSCLTPRLPTFLWSK